MKLACQEGMTPGATLDEKLANLEAWGYEGLEVGGGGLNGRVPEINKAIAKSKIKVSSVCGGFRGCLLEADKAQRDLAIGEIKEIVQMAADLGAVGMILVPVFGAPKLPNLAPLSSPVELERQLLLKILDELGAVAQKAGTLLMIEPLNRYETHFINRLEQAVDIAATVGNPNIKIMADFFHMSIEEIDIPKAIKEAGDWVAHVHLADSTRKLPGYGHTDFKSGFAALKSIGFNNYMAMECGVPGDPKIELKKSADYLKSCMY